MELKSDLRDGEWVEYGGEDCPVCGAEVLILVDSSGYVQDGSPAKCAECDAKGYISADEDGVWINWERDIKE